MTPALEPYLAGLAARLDGAGIDQSRAEVEWILCHVLGCRRLDLYLEGAKRLTPPVIEKVEQIVDRRMTRHPLQFILNEAWFYGRKFYVDENVMAPTPETELLCEQAVAFLRERHLGCPTILDLGIGSGVIAVTVAAEFGECRVLGFDISEPALEVARRNAAAHELAGRIRLRRSDFFSAIKQGEQFDLILSNPPYIAEPDYPALEPEVRADPKIAMTAGEDGLDAIRVILRDAPSYLAKGGRIMFEVGLGQAEKVVALTENDKRYNSLTVIKDLNQRDRIVVLECD